MSSRCLFIWLPLILGTQGLLLPELLYIGTKNVCFLLLSTADVLRVEMMRFPRVLYMIKEKIV